MADVFISYARADEAVARRAAKALAKTGLDVWWDDDLPAHRDYSEVIERKLGEAKAVLVLWSKTAAASQWVRAEADFARNAGKLVQGQLDGTLPPMPFNQIQCADLRGWRGSASHRGWTKLQSSLQALLSGEELPAADSRPARAWDRFQPYRWPVAAILAAFLAVAIYLFAFGPNVEERKPVVAVLPFRSLAVQDQSVAAGMWEDTRTAIGRNPQLVVLGPETAQQLASKGDEAAKNAADYLVHASVRAAGGRIRVSADLVRSSDGVQMWSQDFDRKLDDVFSLQSDIAREIEGRIRGRLAQGGGRTPEHIATSGDLYALYSDARAKVRSRDYDAYPQARDQLQQVLKADPNFAPAWAVLSQVGGNLKPSQNGWKSGDPSEAYARKAIELAPNLAAGHAALAMALRLKGPVARAEVERAVELDPNDYEAWLWLGNMRSGENDRSGALEAYRRALAVEPLFWPAVLNTYGALRSVGDQAGIQDLLTQQQRIGADHLAASIRIEQALERKDLASAANIGLAYLNSGKPEGRAPIGAAVWDTLLQLGFDDEAVRLTPAPDFAQLLWKNDPRGLDLMESKHIDPRSFFQLSPLTENAGRVYLVTGRGARFAELYRSLNIRPSEFRKLLDDDQHFLYVAPLVAVALKQNGGQRDAEELLGIAETTRREMGHPGDSELSALLARIFAVQGRREDAIAQLKSAIDRGWLPQPPLLLVDLSVDPALASLKSDPRFAQLRQNVLSTIAAQRARVDMRLLHQAKAA